MAFWNELSKKHIPTLLGLGVLAGGLGVGVFLVRSRDTSSFLPRASPQTTPKNIKITNVTDTSFSVSWVTDTRTVGFVRYGTNTTNLTTTVNDDRDQSSGTTGLSRTHHITIRALKANTTYYFKLGTGTQELYDDNGKPYSVSTVSSVTGQARTVYGEVVSGAGGGASGALMYITSTDLGPLSAVVQPSGSWVVSLSQARTKDLKSVAQLTSETALSLLAVSSTDDKTSLVTVKLSQAQPVPQITLGTNADFTQASAVVTTPAPGVTATPLPESAQSQFTSSLLAPPTESVSTSTLKITNPVNDGELVTATSPELRGNAPAGTKVTASLKGKTTQTSTITTDPSGIWKWTPPTKLTTGAYTLTASATIQGALQTVTRTFSVDPSQAGAVPAITASESASLAPTPTPTPVPTASVSATPLSTASASATVSNPSTSSGEIVSGGVVPTMILLMSGVVLLFIGTVLWAVL